MAKTSGDALIYYYLIQKKKNNSKPENYWALDNNMITKETKLISTTNVYKNLLN